MIHSGDARNSSRNSTRGSSRRKSQESLDHSLEIPGIGEDNAESMKNEKKKFAQSCREFYNLAHYIGYSPYKYSSEKEMLEFDPKSIYKWLYIAHFLMLLLYQANLIWQSILILRNPKSTMKEILSAVYFPLIFTCPNVCHYFSWKNYGTLHLFFNENIETHKNAQVTLDSKRRSLTVNRGGHISNKMRKFTRVGLVLSMLTGFSHGRQVLMRPESPNVISSLFLGFPRTRQKLPSWMTFLLALVQFNINCFQSYTAVFHGVDTIVYSIHANECFKEMGLNGVVPTKASGQVEISHLLRLSRIYHRVAVLKAINAELNSWYPLLAEICAVFGAIVRLFLAVIYQDGRSFLIGVGLVIAFYIGFTFFSEVSESYEKMKTSWKGITHSWFARFRGSTRPIKISVGGFYNVDRGLILTVLSIIVNDVTSLLIAYRAS